MSEIPRESQPFSSSPTTPTSRRASMISFGSSSGSISPLSFHPPTTNIVPRVQLVPHVHRLSYDSSLSQSERDILDNTSFDAFDLSSQDFDFEDIFTYDRPQKKLPPVIEVTSPTRDNFTFSHYSATTMTRQRPSRNRSGRGEMYVKNKNDARKR